MYYAYLESPVGTLLLAGEDGALRTIRFSKDGRPAAPEAGWVEGTGHLAEEARQLREYFAGTRRVFDLRLSPDGTAFQRAVWQVLTTIPFGKTMSYGAVAAAVGRPLAARAVGAANAGNPLPIVVPCHRVIGSNGRLTGFGGGLGVKEALLRHEKNTAWRR